MRPSCVHLNPNFREPYCYGARAVPVKTVVHWFWMKTYCLRWRLNFVMLFTPVAGNFADETLITHQFWCIMGWLWMGAVFGDCTKNARQLTESTHVNEQKRDPRREIRHTCWRNYFGDTVHMIYIRGVKRIAKKLLLYGKRIIEKPLETVLQ